MDKSRKSATPLVYTKSPEIILSNISCYRQGRLVADDISFIASPNNVFAIVGTSRSGKSSLLKGICEYEKNPNFKVTGSIYMNGDKISRRQLKSSCVYISTDEQFLPYLTVYETLYIAAQVKLAHCCEMEKKNKIEELLVKLRLNHVKDLCIGNEWKKTLSTGEKRRLALGTHLLDDKKSLILIDEPFEGLDSFSAHQLMILLKDLAAKGKTVIISISSASSQIWSQLDKCLFMTEGRALYVGELAGVNKYFSDYGYYCPKNYSVGEFVMSLPLQSQKKKPETIEVSEHPSDHFEKNYPISNDGDDTNLVTVYRQSYYYQNLLNDIQAKVNFGCCPIKRTLSSGKDMCNLHTNVCDRYTFLKHFCRIPLLVRYLFLNSIRNPISLTVALLTQTCHTLILGGIYWKCAASAPFNKEVKYNIQQFLENPVIDLFTKGLDNHQPLLNFLDFGVNENTKSQPILDLINSEQFLVDAYNLLSCSMNFLKDPFDYYNFNSFTVRSADNYTYIQSLNEVDPKQLVGIIVGVIQYADIIAQKEDWTHLKSYLTNSDSFYRGALFRNSFLLADPWMVCSNYPKMLKNSINRYKPSQRKLIEIVDSKYNVAIQDVLGLKAYEFISITNEILDKMSQCEHYACKWINENRNIMTQLITDYYNSGMTLVTIISIFFVCVATLGFASYDALLTFPQQRQLIKQNVAHGMYTLGTYFISKNIAELPFQILPCLIISTIFYLMTGLFISFKVYCVYIVISVLVTFAAYGFGYCISGCTYTLEVAVIVAPVLLFLWLVGAGFVIKAESLPTLLHLTSHTGFYKWGYFAFILNQFSNSAYTHLGVIPNSFIYSAAGIPQHSIFFCTFILFFLGLCYRFIAYLGLKVTLHPALD